MRHLVIILLAIALPFTGVSQKTTWVDGVAYIVLPGVSGFGNGMQEALLWRYDKFQAKYPNADPQQWDPLV